MAVEMPVPELPLVLGATAAPALPQVQAWVK